MNTMTGKPSADIQNVGSARCVALHEAECFYRLGTYALTHSTCPLLYLKCIEL